MEHEIRYCPFCGNEGQLSYSQSKAGQSYIIVKCTICGAQTRPFFAKNNQSESLAVKAWNHRSDE